jgi:hypothetical protein
MTKKEQLDMYMKCSKKELCEMLIEANKHLKNLPIHVVVLQSEQFSLSDIYRIAQGYTEEQFIEMVKHLHG